MKKLIFIFLIFFNFVLTENYREGVPTRIDIMKQGQLREMRLKYRIDPVEFIGQQKTNFFPKKEMDILLVKCKKLKKGTDIVEFFFNGLNQKQREIIYLTFFKKLYKKQIKDTRDIILDRKSIYLKSYKKIEVSLKKDLEKISKKKYNYKKLNKIYKKYRDKIIAEMEKIFPDIFGSQF